MKKLKNIVLIFVLLVLMLIIPNESNAATEYTYSDTEQGIEWTYELDKSNNVIKLRSKTTTKTGAVTIPSKIDGKTVISLSNGQYNGGAFQEHAGITEITIPNSIITIGEYTFEDCTGLKTVIIPDSVTNVGNNAFNGCSGITSITLSKNLTSIGNWAFENCSGLKNIIIPNSVTTIGTGAFYKCSGLKELTLSENLTKITDRAFQECKGLTSVILPDSVTTIEGDSHGAFRDCTNLAKILIPDTVASIGKRAFQGCNKLTIYGNDEMTSKQYAEENEITFDYIANWDKEESGTDITAPIVENIQVTYSSVMNYSKDANKDMYIVPAGAKLVINVNFSENITGTTVPTLTIKFGDGENVQVKEGTVGGSTITYIYTVQKSDKGVMTTVGLSGGNIKDIAGNVATLSCPALTIQYCGDDLVYANGVATNPDSGDDSNDENKNVAVVSISLPSTKTVELGKTITLQPTFNPTNATNKIVTWDSSDKTVATVDNAGKVTPKKVGSTIITVTTQDGNKKATCTVTVTDSLSNNPGSNENIPDFSKAKFNFSYTTYTNLALEITNVELTKDDKCYIYISKKKDENPTTKTEGINRIYKDNNGKINVYFSRELSSNILEVKGKNYIYIVREDSEENSQILLKAKEMEELKLPPLGQRLDIWLYDEEKTGVSNKININSERKITYKMGKIESKDVLKSFKNDSSNQAYSNLLKYAKSAKYLTTGSITVDGLDYNISKDIKLENDAYYFVYMVVETKDGKYNELEDVAIYIENKSTDGKNALVHFAFNTIKVDDDEPDNTVAQVPEIPKAGKSAIIVTVAILIIAGGYIAYKKYKYLNFK